MINDHIGGIVSDLQARVSSLQSQHVTFVSFCSDLISSHVQFMQKELKKSAFPIETTLKITKNLEILERNYRMMASRLGFSVSIDTIEEALQISQGKVLRVLQKKFSEKEAEKQISIVFSELSEVVYRKKFEKKRQNSAKKINSKSMNQYETKINELQHENSLGQKKISELKEKIRLLQSKIDQNRENSATKVRNSLKNLKSSRKNFSITSRIDLQENLLFSPIESPIFNRRKRSQASKLSISGENEFNIENFKEKVGNLACILSEFMKVISKIEFFIVNEPKFEKVLKEFHKIKNDLGKTLKEINSNDKSSKGLIQKNAENEKLVTKVEKIAEKNEKIMEKHLEILRENLKTTELELKIKKEEISKQKEEIFKQKEEILKQKEEILKQKEERKKDLQEVSQLKMINTSLQQDLAKFDIEKDELKLEVDYLRVQIERFQKNNKILHESLSLVENKSKNDELKDLKTKYKESTELIEKYLNKIYDLNQEVIKLNNIISNLNTQISDSKTSEKKLLIEFEEKNKEINKKKYIQRKNNLGICQGTCIKINSLMNFIYFREILQKFEMVSINIPQIMNSKFNFLNDKFLHLQNLSKSFKTKIFQIKSRKDSSKNTLKYLSDSLTLVKSENLSLSQQNKEIAIEKFKLQEKIELLSNEISSNQEKFSEERSKKKKKYSEKLEDAHYEINMLKNQVKKLENIENSLRNSLREDTEKIQGFSQIIDEKNKKIQEIQDENNELKFKNSISLANNGENYKEEFYDMKMKNIQLEKMIEVLNEKKNEENSLEEKKTLEKKVKDLENHLSKEKENFKKAQDSFAKQLTGANLEIHNLKSKISDLNSKINPEISAPSEYNLIKVINFKDLTWYLIEIISENEFIWLNYLPYYNNDTTNIKILQDIEYPQQNIENFVEQENLKLKKILQVIGNICLKEQFSIISDFLRDLNSATIFEFEKLEKVFEKESKPKKVKFYDQIDPIEVKIEVHSDLENEIRKYKSEIIEKNNQIVIRDEKLKNNEAVIKVFKEKEVKFALEMEKFDHTKILISKFIDMHPNLSSECIAIIDILSSILQINKSFSPTSKKL